LSILHLLADAPTSQSQVQPIPWWANQQNVILLLLFVMVAFIWFSSSRAKRNEQKTRDDMLRNMKRGDRVMTVGGILGTVVDVRDTEVVLKVDESSNTKIKFTRDAIKRVLAEDEAAGSTK
jgi:preprotein translocase subunit YajC